MRTSPYITVKYPANKANDFDKLVSEVAQKYHAVRVVGGKIEFSINDQPISTSRTITFKFTDKDSKASFISELSKYDGITFEENPWLEMAGLHKDNPLFEEVVAYIESNHQNDFVEELS